MPIKSEAECISEFDLSYSQLKEAFSRTDGNIKYASELQALVAKQISKVLSQKIIRKAPSSLNDEAGGTGGGDGEADDEDKNEGKHIIVLALQMK
jgi:hypothetical protein